MASNFLSGLNTNEFSTLAKEILSRNSNGKIGVDTLEIVGYTDGQAVRTTGNLDDALPEFLAGRNPNVGRLRPGSNNDWGLLRSLAVKKAWEEFVQQQPQKEILAKVIVRSYSAGQTIPIGEGPKDDPEIYRRAEDSSRRIEIRLTKLK